MRPNGTPPPRAREADVAGHEVVPALELGLAARLDDGNLPEQCGEIQQPIVGA